MMTVKRVEGERIYLAPLDPDNLSLEYQAWMKDPAVLRFLANPEADYSLSELQGFVRQVNGSSSSHLWGIFLKSTAQHVGNVKVGGIDPRHLFADVGIIIGERSLWGQGFATEAIRLAATCAFKHMGLHKLMAGITVGNEGSYRAFQKAGFKDAGRYRNHWMMDHVYKDVYLVELVNEDK